ncbi:MAG: ISAs1 family transposase [Cyanobacteria bacterium J06600_6]
MLTYLSQSTLFYEDLQLCPDLDLRDNRGKRHDLGLVLLGVILGLLRNRDGVLSSIHRSMVHTHGALCKVLGFENKRVVSRSQLPLVLEKVNGSAFSALLFSHFGVELSETEHNWFAVDGKELRGSIEKGHKRAEALIQAVSHQEGQCVAQRFYHGRKQSEKPMVRHLLREYGLLGQAISLDALHMNPATLREIAQADGVFLVGLKDNQKDLATDMAHYATRTQPIEEEQSLEKGHGRIERRTYKAFDVKNQYFDPRWENCQFTTLIQVRRQRTEIAKGKHSDETAYFLSNQSQEHSTELFQAVRKHWSVETNNYIRDVTLKEDRLRTKNSSVSRIMATLRSLVIRMLQKIKPINMSAKLEEYQDNWDALIDDLRQIRFL